MAGGGGGHGDRDVGGVHDGDGGGHGHDDVGGVHS